MCAVGEISAVDLNLVNGYNWLRIMIPKELLTCNLICSSAGRAGEVVSALYLVSVTDSSGVVTVIVGGLEILGELVLATKEEIRLIDSGNVDYNYIFDSLSMVNAPLSQA